jgi:hypothetical protein
MIANVFDMLFGCWHRRYSFPITTRAGRQRPEAAAVTGTYVVCLDCGKEFPYDWQRMKVVSGHPVEPAMEADQQRAEAA